MTETPPEDVYSTCQQFLHDSVIIEKMAKCSKFSLLSPTILAHMFSTNTMILV